MSVGVVLRILTKGALNKVKWTTIMAISPSFQEEYRDTLTQNDVRNHGCESKRSWTARCTRGFLSPPRGLFWEPQKRLYYLFWPKFIHCAKSKCRIMQCQFNNIGQDGDTVNNNNKKNWKNEMYSSLAHTRRCWYTNITVKITIIFNTEKNGNL